MVLTYLNTFKQKKLKLGESKVIAIDCLKLLSNVTVCSNDKIHGINWNIEMNILSYI